MDVRCYAFRLQQPVVRWLAASQGVLRRFALVFSAEINMPTSEGQETSNRGSALQDDRLSPDAELDWRLKRMSRTLGTMHCRRYC